MSDYGQSAGALAAARLQPYQGDADLTDAITAELTQAAARLRGRFRCIRDYDTLSAGDQAAFDTAVGLTAAITLLMPAAAGAGNGLSKLKSEDFEYTFLVPSDDEQGRWAGELADALSEVSCIRNARVTVGQSLNVINVNGRTRQREALGRYALTRMIAALLPAGWGGDRRSYVAPPGVDVQLP